MTKSTDYPELASIEGKYIKITMEKVETWEVPVWLVALDRAKYYAHEYGDNINESLRQDTLPVFKDDYEMIDWAANNMNWCDVKDHATLVESVFDVDRQEGWCNGDKTIITKLL